MFAEVIVAVGESKSIVRYDDTICRFLPWDQKLNMSGLPQFPQGIKI